jgi:death-on-curing protein
MNQPLFLSVADVIRIHAGTIAEEGGLGGVRDYGLLVSAVMLPQQSFGGRLLHKDLPAMAAAYLFHIVRNRPFHDGNKRTGAMAAYAFMDANGTDLTAAPRELERTVQAVAAGQFTKRELIEWMGKHTAHRRPGRR